MRSVMGCGRKKRTGELVLFRVEGGAIPRVSRAQSFTNGEEENKKERNGGRSLGKKR